MLNCAANLLLKRRIDQDGESYYEVEQEHEDAKGRNRWQEGRGRKEEIIPNPVESFQQ